MFLALGALAAGCATVELAPDEAYVLSQLGYSKGFLLRGIILRNADTDEEVLLEPGRVIVKRVPPGRYYMRRIESRFDNLATSPSGPPAALIPVEAGKVNYIGSWAVILTEERQSRLYYSIAHDYPASVIAEARTGRGREALSRYELVIARPEFDLGVPPVAAPAPE